MSGVNDTLFLIMSSWEFVIPENDICLSLSKNASFFPNS